MTKKPSSTTNGKKKTYEAFLWIKSTVNESWMQFILCGFLKSFTITNVLKKWVLSSSMMRMIQNLTQNIWNLKIDKTDHQQEHTSEEKLAIALLWTMIQNFTNQYMLFQKKNQLLSKARIWTLKEWTQMKARVRKET